MDESLKSLRETVNKKLKSKTEIDKQLAELEKQKQSLELNDKWEEAYAKIERSIESTKNSHKAFLDREVHKNKATKKFFEEIESEHFVLKEEDLKHTSKVSAFVLKDKFVEEDTRGYDLIRDFRPYVNDRHKYKEEEVVWEKTSKYKSYKIKFVPFNAVNPPKGYKPYSQEQLDKMYDIEVSKDYTDKWTIDGLGYELSKRHYKTGRSIPNRTLEFFKRDLRQKYRDSFTSKLEKKWKQELIDAGYITEANHWYFGSSHSSSFKLDNGVTVNIDCSFDYEKGTGKMYVSSFKVPKPELNTREMTMEEAVEKLESLKVTFD